MGKCYICGKKTDIKRAKIQFCKECEKKVLTYLPPVLPKGATIDGTIKAVANYLKGEECFLLK